MRWETVLATALLLSLRLCSTLVAAETVRVDGIWQGRIVYAPAEIELDVLVEMAPDSEGQLTGTIDVPSQKMKFHPLSRLTVEGRTVTFEFEKNFENGVPGEFVFTGELSADGREMRGLFKGWRDDEGRNHVPFSLTRTGEAGDPRVEEVQPPLTVPADLVAELKARFNAEAGHPRLLILLSPTCGVCLASARVIETYVLDRLDAPQLRVYVVWGPMQGREQEEDARRATAFLDDPRATHYWTPSQELAERLQGPLGLVDELAWDTFLVFSPEQTWEESPPTPAYAMHVGRSLPKERRLNGEKLYAELRQRISPPADPPPDPPAR